MATTPSTTSKKKSTSKKTSGTTTRRKKKTSGTQIIPGVNISISWKKLLGITKLKRWFTNKTGIPTTEAGMERKLGRWIIGLITGGNKKEEKKTVMEGHIENQAQ
ncbi:MAG: hypothetical protein K5856_08170 [Bacteroidaceae bacterium]|nr:hypothetical protein [Bacteroidaceae bacterium]